MPDEYRYADNYIDYEDDDCYEYDVYRPAKPSIKYKLNYDYEYNYSDYLIASDINDDYYRKGE